MRILLVEDEPEMAAALSAALNVYDMVVDHVTTLAAAELCRWSPTMPFCWIANCPTARACR
jgi:DNA-binding response OmpR family regulator